MIGAESELLKDFKDAVSKINFESYNPNSPEFASALAIGKMWRLVHKLNECGACKKALSGEAETDEIAEKIAAAKRHLQRFLNTDNDTYRQMSKDELAHADALIKIEMPGADATRVQKLRRYADDIKAVAAQM